MFSCIFTMPIYTHSIENIFMDQWENYSLSNIMYLNIIYTFIYSQNITLITLKPYDVILKPLTLHLN